jgi:hypothetical protein
MKPSIALGPERFRTTLFVFYALGSLLPTLVIIYVIYQYVWPGLSESQLGRMAVPLAVGLCVMLVVPLLGLLLMSWWVRSLEKLTATSSTKPRPCWPISRICRNQRNPGH